MHFYINNKIVKMINAAKPTVSTSKTMLSFLQFDKPTTEQVQVLSALQNFVCEENTEDFLVICGSAGTGKSSIMNAVVKFAEYNKIRVQIAAPQCHLVKENYILFL